MRLRGVWWTTLAIWLALVMWLTLRSAPAQAARVAELPWYCLLCGEAGTADFLLNLLMFAPLGVAANALALPRWRVFAFALALTVAIERSQWHLLVGRDGSLGDVIANSGGAVLGWFAYPLLRSACAPSQRFARNAIAMVLVVTTMVWIGTGIGLAPAPSDALPWTGQLQHRWPGHDVFPGRILHAAINGIAIPNDPMSAAALSRDSVTATLELIRTGVRLPPRLASLVRVVDAEGRPQLAVTESGADVVTEIPLRATRWGLHTPEWVFTGAMEFGVGRPWQMVAQWRRDGVRLTSAASEPVTGATVQLHPLSIAMGWVFVHPFVRMIGTNARLWNYLWLAWWFGLVAWFAAGLHWRAVVGAVAAQSALLMGVAVVTSVPWHADELIVGIAAAGMAAFCGRLRASPPR